jgi:hypothetical protein
LYSEGAFQNCYVQPSNHSFPKSSVQQALALSLVRCDFTLSLVDPMSNAAHSQLFQPFRCIGHITSNVPVAMTKLGQANFVAVSIGKAFQVYNVRVANPS